MPGACHWWLLFKDGGTLFSREVSVRERVFAQLEDVRGECGAAGEWMSLEGEEV